VTSNKDGDAWCFDFDGTRVSTFSMSGVAVIAVEFLTSVPTEYFNAVLDWVPQLCFTPNGGDERCCPDEVGCRLIGRIRLGAMCQELTVFRRRDD
jgi:hypothetical protein